MTDARMKYVIDLGKDEVFVLGDTADELLESAEEVAKVATDLQKAATTIRNAFNIVNEASKKSGPVRTTQKRNQSRTVKPKVKKNAEAVYTDEVCDHDQPYKDCLGMQTRSGNPYKFRYYPTCNEDCEAWGEQE